MNVAKRLVCTLLSVLVFAGVFAAAPSVMAASGAKPVIEEIEHKGGGYVEVDFDDDVSYRSLSLRLKDTRGKTYRTQIVKTDDDGIDFRILGFRANRTYKLTIRGVSLEGANNFTNVKGRFRIAKGASRARIEDIEYKGNGRVEVDFEDDISYYGKLRVIVKDTTGKSYRTTVTKSDDDEINFRVRSFRPGRQYRFTIKGICQAGAGKNVSVSGSFAIPSSGKVAFEKVEYDLDDQELKVDFKNNVRYKNPRVVIKDSSGKSYSAQITDRDEDDMEIRVALTPGRQYTLTIHGIKEENARSYGKAKTTFTVQNDDDDGDDDDD